MWENQNLGGFSLQVLHLIMFCQALCCSDYASLMTMNNSASDRWMYSNDMTYETPEVHVGEGNRCENDVLVSIIATKQKALDEARQLPFETNNLLFHLQSP